MLCYTASRRASCVLKELPGSQPIRSSVNFWASALPVSGKLPWEHQAGGSSKRTPRFPLITLKGNKAEIIAEVQRDDRGVFQQCLRKGKVWQSSQLHGVRQGLGGVEPVRGALLFSLPCSSVAHDWAAQESCEYKGTGKEQISHWGTTHGFYKYTIQLLEMQQGSMREVINIFPIISFDFSSLIAVLLEISTQAFYF